MTDPGAPAPDRPEPQARRYSAFLSYPHADRAAAFRLHARLEGYRLPRKLAGQVGVSRIRPVFIDRAEMSAAPHLGEALRGALADADYLIVVATPRTPASDWVGREIEAFRNLRGPGRILVALLDGDETTSFHPALSPPGRSAAELPLAADFRRSADGPRLALLKLVAPLLGVDLDELVHRDARRQRHRALGWLAGIVLLALALAGLGWSVWQARTERDRERISASRAMERQLDDLRAEIRAGGTLDMATALTRNVAMFYEGQPATGRLPEVELGRAKLLQAEAEDRVNRGDLPAAAAKAREALQVTGGVLASEPDDTKAIFMHAQSAYWVGLVAWRQGDTPLAANAFARYGDLADRLVKADPGNQDWQLERAYANSNLGTLALREAKDPRLAWQYFSTAQAIFRDIAARKPDDLDSLYNLADGEAWLADTLVMDGKLAEAMQHRAEQRRLLGEMIARAPSNRLYRSLEIGAQLGQATLEGSQHHYANAVRLLRGTLDEARGLAAEDAANESLANQRRAVELFLARAEIDLSPGDGAALGRARRLIGDCFADWSDTAQELPVFCSILAARLAARSGQPDKARAIMADPRVAQGIGRRELTPRWHLDLPQQCGQIGLPGVCSAPRDRG